ncbi:MAG: alpha/beta hydrolase fold domain-containing protein [Propionibacteriaceae bacterium]|nr:alpha/beta hydrolase fold domain-containing protein [Propionibacteriaceae bacterium]
MAFTVPDPLVSPTLRALGFNKPFLDAEAARQHVRACALRPQPYAPGKRIRRDVVIDVDRLEGWPVYQVMPTDASSTGVVIFAHGGGWVNEMSFIHWNFVTALVAEAQVTVIVPIYPLIPFGHAAEVVDRFVEIVRDARARHPRTAIAGDSAGGQIAFSAALELRDRHGITLDDTILISPVVDARLENPGIEELLPRDPLLGVDGTRVFIDLWRGELSVTDQRVSPLLGDLQGLGPVLLFTGTEEILAPDIRLLAERLTAAGVPVEFHEAPGQIHDYPLWPVKAAQGARDVMVERLRASPP